MIRHGEKPAKDANSNDVDGLSAQGTERAQYLSEVFGPNSPYDIGYILAEHPKKGYTPFLFLLFHYISSLNSP